jgi:hypothetical protein
MGKNIEFQVTLDKWDGETGYWLSDILLIPGVTVDKIYYGGHTASVDEYQQSKRGIRWHNSSNRPQRITVDFVLTKDFNKLAESDLFFKKLTAVLSISTLILGIVVAVNNKGKNVEKPAASQEQLKPIGVKISSPPASETKPAISKSPQAAINNYEKLYDEKKFPLDTCGKVINQRADFVVYVPREGRSTVDIPSKFCIDVKDTLNWYSDRIQVATFTNEVDAQEFLDFIKKRFPGGWKSRQ